MKVTFISGLFAITLLCAGCAATGSGQDTAAPAVIPPPQPIAESPPKRAPKPRPSTVKPPQPASATAATPAAPPANDTGATNAYDAQNIEQWQPNVTVPAHYPQKALDRGVEGFVTLEFTVTKTGSLQDIVVIDSSPPGYFEEAAMKAATEFRYQPRLVNGEPVDVPRSRYQMIFKLEYIRPRP